VEVKQLFCCPKELLVCKKCKENLVKRIVSRLANAIPLLIADPVKIPSDKLQAKLANIGSTVLKSVSDSGPTSV
jgi:hypothetical protein